MIFHHIGIAVKSLESGAGTYKLMGFEAGQVFSDPIQKVRICFPSKTGLPLIELIEPLDAASPVTNILDKTGRAVAFDHKKFCFPYNRNIGLIEIIERGDK